MLESLIKERTETKWKEITEDQQAIILEFKHFLKYEQNRVDLTITTYARGLLIFCAFIQKNPQLKKSLLNIDKGDITCFLEYLKEEKNYSNTTAAHYLSSLRKFYSWLGYRYGQEKFADINFFLRSVLKLKQDHTIPFLPSLEDIEKLRKTLKLHRDFHSSYVKSQYYKEAVRACAVFELLITSGIRSNELRNLRREDIDLGNRIMIIKYGKGGFQRKSLFGDTAQEALKEYFESTNPNPQDYAFNRMKNGNCLHYLIKRWARRAGINPQIHAHSFRHYFITQSQLKGISAPVVANQVGHRNIQTTLHYTHFDANFIKKQYDEIKI